MTAAINTGACRKCGALNPVSNQYCVSCGAILQVSTAMMKAQPTPVRPFFHTFQSRWLFISIFVLLGFGALCTAVVLTLSALLFNASISELKFGMTEMRTSAIPLLLLALAVFCAAFFGAGMWMSRLAKDRKSAETVLASIIVSAFIGGSGMMVSTDFLVASLILGLPVTGAVWMGARCGGKPFERSQ